MLAGAKIFGALRDLDLRSRTNPPVDSLRLVCELIHAVVEADEYGGARPIERHHRGHLIAARRSDDARLRAPDANDSAHRPVLVDDGRAVQRVPADAELAVFMHHPHLWLF